jgi:tetratricopeptide (TPR) repeat protein
MSLWGRIFGLEKNHEYELGIQYFNEGKYELAAVELEKAIGHLGHSDPEYALGMFYAAESHAHLGSAKYHAEDLEGALEHFTKAARENPTYPDLFYRMGVIHHRKGDEEQAVEMLRKAIGLNSSYFEAVCYLGVMLYERGEREEADELFERAVRIGAQTPSPISKFLSDHLAGKETDIPPLAAIRELISNDTDFEDTLKEGIEAFNTGSYGIAVGAFEKAVGIHPDYPDVRFKLGLAYLREGAHEVATREFQEALRINPGYTEARFYLGIAYLDERLFSKALPHFERAVQEQPDYADLRCYLGVTYFHLGDLEKARGEFENALTISPSYKKACYYHGLLLYMLGEKTRATELITKAIEGEMKKTPLNVSLALVHLREGNLEEAMTVLHEILNAGHASPDVLYFVGEVYLRMEHFDEAESFFRKSIEGNPSFLRAREKLAHVLMKKGKLEEAEELLETFETDFADLYKIKGDIKFNRGDIDSALSFYRKSLEVNSEYGEAVLSLAMTLRKKGLEEEAEQVLKRLIEIDPENVVARNMLGRGPLDLDTP